MTRPEEVQAVLILRVHPSRQIDTDILHHHMPPVGRNKGVCPLVAQHDVPHQQVFHPVEFQQIHGMDGARQSGIHVHRRGIVHRHMVLLLRTVLVIGAADQRDVAVMDPCKVPIRIGENGTVRLSGLIESTVLI